MQALHNSPKRAITCTSPEEITQKDLLLLTLEILVFGIAIQAPLIQGKAQPFSQKALKI